MSRFQLVGCAEDANTLADVLNSRRKQLGLTMSEFNTITGFADNYCHKIFAPNYRKNLGHLSLPVFLQALGCRLVVIADDEALPPVTVRAINEKHLSPSKIEPFSRIKKIA